MNTMRVVLIGVVSVVMLSGCGTHRGMMYGASNPNTHAPVNREALREEARSSPGGMPVYTSRCYSRTGVCTITRVR